MRQESTRLLHFASRNCACSTGVGCSKCNGKKRYFDEPVPIFAILTDGSNRSEKKSDMPRSQHGSYKLVVEPVYRVAQGDRVIPFGIREFEHVDETIDVERGRLTFVPINPRGVLISFPGSEGIVDYRFGTDFTIKKEKYGRVPLFSKTITWLTDPLDGQTRFTARYDYLPEFEVAETPPARISQGQLVMQQLDLSKITVAGEEKTTSGRKSEATIIDGMEYV